MPKIHVSKSITIHASVEKTYEIISDFNHWLAWSPWLIQEPDAKVDIAKDGKFYEWEGQRVGSGNMKVTREEKLRAIDYDLNFLKPWKSKAKVRFELTPQGEQVKATWFMDSGLPFFMFWMKKMMITYIGMDYQRGLALLKDYVEDGVVHSKLDFTGYSDYPGCTYIGVQTSCTLDTVGPKMKQDFTQLFSFLRDRKDLIAGQGFSIYHQWDMVRNKIKYTSGIPVKSIPNDLPEGIISGKIPQTKLYKIIHTGPYLHLGNAWTSMYTMQRSKAFALNKKIDPFEVYLNMPGLVTDNELITEVCFAVK